MTKEEAINLLKQVNKILINSNSWLENTHEPLNQAFDMAIKALEQQKPMEKFENAKDHIRKLASDYKCYDNRLTDEEALELCHILEQQPSDESIKYLECNNIDVQKFTEALKKQRLQVIKPNICDDCVSRTQAIEWIENLRQMDKCFGNYEDDYFSLSEVIDRLKNVPPVTPTHGICKDCKHWKDSDGVYRRGIGAESKCPVNNSRVFEGTFCCADFEKRGNEND